jgi:serine protease
MTAAMIAGALALSPAATARAARAPAAITGNLLVLLDRPNDHAQAAAATRTVEALVARLGGSLAGHVVPEVGLITVRPSVRQSLPVLAALLRTLPGVASVQLERRLAPRTVPNDPALTARDQFSVVVQWTLAKEGFYGAWAISRGDGAKVGVIDTGVDGTHPELSSKIAAAIDQQARSDASGTARTDEVGHGTHVASLACADTNNGIGMAGAGYNCKLVIEKTDFSISSVVASIVDATKRHVQALNMSFGPSSTATTSPPDAEVRALDYAAAHGVVMVAAAADNPTTEQGDPANVLQPMGTAGDLRKGIGLDVTAARYDGRRASFAGYGSEVSLAAYGALNPGAGGIGIAGPAPGIFGAFPSNITQSELLPSPCGCRTTFQGSSNYAYLQGTSMAAPQVAALAAMMKVLNPFATVADVLRTIKLKAKRPPGTRWGSDLGWGILNAGASLDAIRRIDPPVSRLAAPKIARHREFALRWSARDRRWPGLIPSPIARYELYVSIDGHRARLLVRTRRRGVLFEGHPGHRYTFYVIAIDRAGNRERPPVSSTTRVAPNAS